MSVYKKVKYYDIAFNYRDIKEESNFFIELYEKFTGKSLLSFLEVAAGPARHTIEFAKKGISAGALDLEPAMRTYALDKARKNDVSIDYYLEDMSKFNLDKKYDLIVNLLDSLPYVLNIEDAFTHFESISNTLNSKGIYFIELMHPRNVLKGELKEADTLSEWEAKEEKVKLNIQWGNDKDYFDPVTLISNVSVKIDYNDNGEKGTIEETHKLKAYFLSEIKAIIHTLPELEILDVLGSFNLNTPFADTEESSNMNIVIGKK